MIKSKQKLIMPIDVFNDMIVKLYDSEINVTLRVKNFLHAIREKIYFDKALVFFYKKVDGLYEVKDYIPIDWKESELESYFSHYCKIDDTLPSMDIKTPIIFRCSELFDNIERKKTIFYKEFINPANLQYSIEGNLNIANSEVSGGIGLYRASSKKDFTDAELELMKLFQPHLSNLLKDHRGEEIRPSVAGVLGLLEGHNAVGICVLNEKYQIKACNNTYRKIIDEKSTKSKNNIEEKIKEICKIIDTNNEVDTYEYKFEGCSLFIGVSKETVKESSDGGKFTCFIYDLSYMFSKSLEQIKMKYDLTSKEYEVLTRVLEGHKYEDIAKELFISLHTVKKHLSSIYNKMGLENQREIINKLGVF